jgi:hypothetical protein
MNTRYYHDPPIGYLVVWGPGSHRGGSDYEGRAACVPGHPESCCTQGISRKYLAMCKRIPLRDVPQQWRVWLEPR